MALPDALERRELLYGRPRRAPDYAALGDRYHEAGRRLDALEAYWRIPDEAARAERIARLEKEAVEHGGAFLLLRIATRQPVDRESWRKASANAEAAGKLRYALMAAKEAGDAEVIEALERKLGIGVEPAEGPPPTAAEADVW